MEHQEGAMRKTMLAVASHATQVNAGDTFSEPHAISALAALAQPTRLAIFRLLIKHEPIGITAGVIAETVGAPHNTLSSHLAILVRAGLLRSSRDGRTIVYRSDVEGILVHVPKAEFGSTGRELFNIVPDFFVLSSLAEWPLALRRAF